jgi:hypothetical protein
MDYRPIITSAEWALYAVTMILMTAVYAWRLMH